MSDDDVYRNLFLDKQNQLLGVTQKALELQKRLDDMNDFNPRAMKLMKKQKKFVVVAEDEPYFIKVYDLIRKHEREKGTWTDEDERLFKATWDKRVEEKTSVLFCNIHECETILVDYDDGSRYECPECERENGEALGLI